MLTTHVALFSSHLLGSIILLQTCGKSIATINENHSSSTGPLLFKSLAPSFPRDTVMRQRNDYITAKSCASGLCRPADLMSNRTSTVKQPHKGHEMPVYPPLVRKIEHRFHFIQVAAENVPTCTCSSCRLMHRFVAKPSRATRRCGPRRREARAGRIVQHERALCGKATQRISSELAETCDSN